MVAAHLRGLLQPQLKYGLRSAVTENIILEALVCEQRAAHLQDTIRNDLSMTALLNEKGLNRVMDHTGRRTGRVSELRDYDLYNVEEQIARRIKVDNVRQELSLYQLYQLAERGDVFNALSAHYDTLKQKPLL